MAFFSDLTPCTYFPGETSKLVAVGWLEHGHRFEIGPVDEMLLLRLRELLTDPWAFRAAVLDCPPMRSPEYLAAVAAHYRFP